MKIDDVIYHYLMDCQNKGRTEDTLISYKQRLAAFADLLAKMCGVTEIERVSVLHLRQFVQCLMGNDVQLGSGQVYPGYCFEGSVLELSTVRAYVRVIKSFFNWCYQEELIDINPASRLVAPRPPKKIRPTFKPEHIEKMLAACDLSTDLGFRDYVMLLLLLDTGMRLGEISILRVADVHDTYVKVFGKGRKEREIGIHPEMSKLLWKYIHKYRRPKNPDEAALFLSCGDKRNGQALSYEGVQEAIRRIQETSGLRDIKFSAHVFRHTFAKMYMEQGGEIFKLSREMGHSDVQVTKIYLENFGSTEARKQHAAFSPISLIQLKKSTRSRKGKKTKGG